LGNSVFIVIFWFEHNLRLPVEKSNKWNIRCPKMRGFAFKKISFDWPKLTFF
jgi:hypothetical protein